MSFSGKTSILSTVRPIQPFTHRLLFYGIGFDAIRQKNEFCAGYAGDNIQKQLTDASTATQSDNLSTRKASVLENRRGYKYESLYKMCATIGVNSLVNVSFCYDCRY